MKIVDAIRLDNRQGIEFDCGDYRDGRERLLATIPEGCTLMHVRRDG
ncbi:hypothetical protein IEE92_13365 [Kocuria sp. cx-116]|nr:hypothetical protein [Kocuria sp. cx-116]MBD2763517.1 hypothetical protein [Kocuria sp. cx-116]